MWDPPLRVTALEMNCGGSKTLRIAHCDPKKRPSPSSTTRPPETARYYQVTGTRLAVVWGAASGAQISNKPREHEAEFATSINVPFGPSKTFPIRSGTMILDPRRPRTTLNIHL